LPVIALAAPIAGAVDRAGAGEEQILEAGAEVKLTELLTASVPLPAASTTASPTLSTT
jgi:hypothetical protein